jgi:hypothetical protein
MAAVPVMSSRWISMSRQIDNANNRVMVRTQQALVVCRILHASAILLVGADTGPAAVLQDHSVDRDDVGHREEGRQAGPDLGREPSTR